MAEAGGASPFSARTIAWVIVAGLIGFLGFIWLTAYAPQLKMRSGEIEGPLSKSAVGFYGIYHLAELTGRPVDLNTDRDSWRWTGLTIVVIGPETDPAQLKALITARRDNDETITLYILPKWITMPSPRRSGWVQSLGPIEPPFAKEVLGNFGTLQIGQKKTPNGDRVRGVEDSDAADVNVPAPQSLHYIAQGMQPVLVDSQGATVMGRTDLDNGSIEYVLADPDLLSNQALKKPEGARAALAIIDAVRRNERDSVAFDMVLSGMENSRNLLQLMFEPPFLALTLAVLIAAIMTGIHAFGRFGPAAIEPRAIPFGKRALADNSAVLIARAGAEKRLGDRYVALTREAAAGALGASSMEAEAQEEWLARLPHAEGNDFATLANRGRTAPSAHAMLAAARDLFDWRRDVTRDR